MVEAVAVAVVDSREHHQIKVRLLGQLFTEMPEILVAEGTEAAEAEQAKPEELMAEVKAGMAHTLLILIPMEQTLATAKEAEMVLAQAKGTLPVVVEDQQKPELP